jgi:hypothetical protein
MPCHLELPGRKNEGSPTNRFDSDGHLLDRLRGTPTIHLHGSDDCNQSIANFDH